MDLGGPCLQEAEGSREAREGETRQVIKHHRAQACVRASRGVLKDMKWRQVLVGVLL